MSVTEFALVLAVACVALVALAMAWAALRAQGAHEVEHDALNRRLGQQAGHVRVLRERRAMPYRSAPYLRPAPETWLDRQERAIRAARHVS